MQPHSGARLIHRCKRDERATMMLVCRACVRAVGVNIAVENKQSVSKQQTNYTSRVLQNQSMHMQQMHETICATTHRAGVIIISAHVAHVLATEPELGVIIQPT